MPSASAYYDSYWSNRQAPPEEDPWTEERVRCFVAAGGRGLSVLDLGCGSGRGTQLLARSGNRVVGLDVSHGALRRAQKREGAVAYVKAACEAPLPFPASRFDAVYCAEVIEHLLDPESMVRECHRVLKPSGMIFLTTPYHGLLKNLAIAALAFERHFSPAGSHIRFFTARSLRLLLEAAGFRVEKISHLGRCWPFWMNMVVYAGKL